MNNILQIFGYKRLTMSLIIGLLLLLISVIWLPTCILPAFILILNYFDLIGFWILLQSGKLEEINNLAMGAYRILQMMFMISMLLFVEVNFSIRYMSACLILWWFGCQDLMFYFVQHLYGIPDTLSWMSWTPMGIINKSFKIDYITGTEFVIQGIIGCVISLIIATF